MFTTVQTYDKLITSYGVLTILIVMEYLIEQEEYEECQKIIIAINKLSGQCLSPLPTKMSQEAVDDCVQAWRAITGHNPNQFMINCTEYALNILEELKLLKS
jgi:hypothetical protein